jgi:hypothetical protein
MEYESAAGKRQQRRQQHPQNLITQAPTPRTDTSILREAVSRAETQAFLAQAAHQPLGDTA